jgi:hypothetical protein
MIQDPNDNSRFSVTSDEPFFVVFTPFPASLVCQTALAADGIDCPQIEICPDVYQVHTDGTRGKVIRVAGKCNFAPDAQDDAYYSISVRDKDGNSFVVVRIPNGPFTEFLLTITVQ